MAQKLSDEFSAWVDQYAKKICPEGCLPTPGQIIEVDLLARVMIALLKAEEEQE